MPPPGPDATLRPPGTYPLLGGSAYDFSRFKGSARLVFGIGVYDV
jgi:hypothetical protein